VFLPLVQRTEDFRHVDLCPAPRLQLACLPYIKWGWVCTAALAKCAFLPDDLGGGGAERKALRA
jgi:hypothetical protein